MTDFGIDQGASLGGVDSDGDGLTDEFERMAGTDAHQFDTDHDGLSDGYESMVSRTSALLADTDHDGLTDSTEVSIGTNPLDVDTDHDGLTDPLEVQYGSNPLASSLGTSTNATGPDDPADAAHHMPDIHSGADAGWH